MSLFTTHQTVPSEWIDHNGHMNVAYYVLAFDVATDAVYETWGLGEQYPETSGCSVFTLGIDVDYLSELFEGDRITITTQLLDWDYKRIHYYHRLVHAKSGKLTAVNECLAMNVHLGNRRSTPFPEDVQENLAAVYKEQQQLKKPVNSARRLAIKRKKQK
jgi:acyl-CoA thioester hydrolase